MTATGADGGAAGGAEPRVEVHADQAALAAAIAGELLTRLAEAQRAGGVPQVALTGGTIADVVHRELVRLSRAGDHGVDWSRVVLWFGDERFVPAGSEDRNALQARHAFLDDLGATAHEVPSSDDVATAEEAAEAYAATLREHGSGTFDVVMLGVGPDGHVASLFPGFPQLDVDDAVAVAVHDSPKPPPDRVSLTFAALNRARAVWFLVSGEGKAEAVARALAPATTSDGSPTPGATVRETPARGVHGQDETTWFLDADAASRL